MEFLQAIVSSMVLMFGFVQLTRAAEHGGKPEKSDVVVTYAQPSGAFTPIWLAYEAGLFKKYGLNASLQLLTPQVSAQAVVSEEADFYTDGPDLISARLPSGQVKYFGGTYDAFAPYWAMSLGVRPEAISGQFDYIDEKQFPKAKSADPKEFYDNSFVDGLTKSGFLKNVGMK